jgi:outer membrane protein
VQLINSENAYAIAKAGLNQAMGVETSEDYEVAADTLPELPEEERSAAELWSEALRLRPELSVLERRARAQRLYVRAAKAEYAPTLSASSAFTDAGLKLNDLTWNWNAGLLLSWPLFEGGATRASVTAAQATERGVLADQDAARLAVRFEVEQARLGVRAAKAVREAADEALRNARERLKLAEGRYAAGVGNVIELGDAQFALTSAEAQRVQAEFNLAMARASLLNALGKTQ